MSEKEIHSDETLKDTPDLTHRSRFRCLALVVFVAIEFYHSLPTKIDFAAWSELETL